ncbi:MAG: hypothetical protein FJ213_07620 [Ignavibacteria bacterium]|nr:hypothetical protein [Ignavibacteria bacterium]
MKIVSKILFVTLVIALVSATAFGQAYKKGDKMLNAGIGFGFGFGTGTSDLPPISLGFQFLSLEDKISLGAIVGYASSTDELNLFTTKYTWKYTYIIVGARGEYHLLESSKNLDAYVGVTLGYNNVTVTTPSGYAGAYSVGASGLLYGGVVGARYYFSPSLGVFGEFGYGISYLTAGVAVKL